MSKRIEKFLAKLLKNPKKLTQILHSSVVESGFKWFFRVVKEKDSDGMLFAVCFLLIFIELIFIIGWFMILGIL